MTPAPAPQLAPQLEPHRRQVWGLAYRMLGVAADADDIVQDTFLTALERPPPDLGRPLRGWLMRVATNRSLDLLRRRRRRGWVGPWLPSPIDAANLPDPAESAEARYGRLESASFAFLLALEQLTPQQRAVLLLRDVLDWDAAAVATTLDTSPTNVRMAHSRARRKMAGYDADRCLPSPALAAATQHALMQFMTCLATGDAVALNDLFRDEARALSDGGGRFFASRKTIVGGAKIAKVYLSLAKQGAGRMPELDLRVLNGVAAAVLTDSGAPAGHASRWTWLVDVHPEDGRITRLYGVLSPEKLRPPEQLNSPR